MGGVPHDARTQADKRSEAVLMADGRLIVPGQPALDHIVGSTFTGYRMDGEGLSLHFGSRRLVLLADADVRAYVEVPAEETA